LVPLTLIADTHLLTAMLLLYALLACASFGVGLRCRRDSQLRNQVNAWWYIFPVVCLGLFLYPFGLLLLPLLIALLAIRELSTHFSGRPWRFAAACIALLALLALPPLLAGAGFDVPLYILPLLIAAQTLHFAVRRKGNPLLYLLFLLLCFGVGFLPALTRLPLAPATKLHWLFYLFVVTALNDVAQFVSGTLFGRHAVAARISPNKTWQGLAGGVLASMLLSLALGLFLQLAAAPRLLALGLLLSIGGFLGDLTFSAAKRTLGIKDFSGLIPGHGGILDRVDSLVLTAPLLYAALSL
jgi:phosphatidate cytidylyltransferase